MLSQSTLINDFFGIIKIEQNRADRQTSEGILKLFDYSGIRD